MAETKVHTIDRGTGEVENVRYSSAIERLAQFQGCSTSFIDVSVRDALREQDEVRLQTSGFVYVFTGKEAGR